MSIGFTATNVATQIVPDRSLSATSTSNIRTARFGDGYEQRAVSGINSLSQEYAISLMNRSKTEVDDIIAFFETKKGVTAFNFTIPDTNSTSATTGTTGGSHDTSNSLVLTLSTANPNISTGSVVTGSGVSGTVTVTAVSGTSVTVSTAQSINTNIILTFTNQNEKTFKVICADWNVVYGNTDLRSINTTFRRVYET
jgi:phage-related protein